MILDHKASQDLSLHASFEWLVRVDELPRSPMEKMGPPKVRKAPPSVFTIEQIGALFDTSNGKEFDFRHISCFSLGELMKFLAHTFYWSG